MFTVKEKYKGKGVRISVQVRPGHAKKIDLDTATDADLKLLGEIKHPYVEMKVNAAKAAK